MNKHKAAAKAGAAFSKIKILMNSNDKFNQDAEQFAGFPMLKRSLEATEATARQIDRALAILGLFKKEMNDRQKRELTEILL